MDFRKTLFANISRHFRSKRNFYQKNSKWPPAAIFDCRKHFSLTFLAISGQIATFIFYLKNGRRQPFWIFRKHFSLTFLAISGQNATFIKCFQNGHRRPFWIFKVIQGQVKGHFLNGHNDVT